LVGFVDPRDANRYAYAGDNPVNFIDPSGLSFWPKVIGAVKGCIERAVNGPDLAPGVDILKKVRRVVIRIPAPQSRGAIAAVGCIEGAAKSFV
jgi:hypothetical protein